MANKGDGEPPRDPVAITRIFNNYLNSRRDEDFQVLFKELYPRVAAYVNSGHKPSDPAVDGEDVALSVFRSLHNRVQSGSLKRIDDRWKLWSNLKQWANQKVIDQNRKAKAAKRDVSRRDADFQLDEMASRDLDPAAAATLKIDAATHKIMDVLSRLHDPESTVVLDIAVRRLLGYSDNDIRHVLQMEQPEYDEHMRTITTAFEEAASS